MNRDELLSRGVAHPPAIHSYKGIKVIHPLDVSGGSWIAVNEEGTTWGLLNWNITAKSAKERSRGEVVLAIATVFRPDDADTRISTANLSGIDPFRLVGIFGVDRTVREWRWDGAQLLRLTHSWERNHWFSSGKSDERAAEQRAAAFAGAAGEPDAESLQWLRRIHASHQPEKGAFSVCVHRDDAATVSYTEVQVSPAAIEMVYRPGSPCQGCSNSRHVRIALPRTIPV